MLKQENNNASKGQKTEQQIHQTPTNSNPLISDGIKFLPNANQRNIGSTKRLPTKPRSYQDQEPTVYQWNPYSSKC